MKRQTEITKYCGRHAVFTAASILSALLIVFTLAGCRDTVRDTDNRLHINEETIDIENMDGEFRLFFIADSHISKCDARDVALIPKAAERAYMYRTDEIDSWDRFDMLMSEAKAWNSDIVVLGGDIIDSAMYASIDHVRNSLAELDRPYMYYMGNHDFEYGDEYYTQKAYEEYLPRLEDLHGNKSWQAVEYDDFIIFAADDGNNQIDKEALEAFKKEVSKGKPVIVSIHVPMEPETGPGPFLNKVTEIYGKEIADSIQLFMGKDGCPPNQVTQEFMDLVMADNSPVILVLAGHVHFYHKEMLNGKTLQIISGPAYSGEALKITLR